MVTLLKQEREGRGIAEILALLKAPSDFKTAKISLFAVKFLFYCCAIFFQNIKLIKMFLSQRNKLAEVKPAGTSGHVNTFLFLLKDLIKRFMQAWQFFKKNLKLNNAYSPKLLLNSVVSIVGNNPNITLRQGIRFTWICKPESNCGTPH